MDIASLVEIKQNPKIPDITPGDTVKVSARIVEGGKERIQVFQGVIIKVRRGGAGASFTVRHVAYGIGVERTFPLYSPLVEKVEVVRHGKVRRAKLYYLRGLSSKAARRKIKRVDRRAKEVPEAALEPEEVQEAVQEEVLEEEQAAVLEPVQEEEQVAVLEPVQEEEPVLEPEAEGEVVLEKAPDQEPVLEQEQVQEEVVAEAPVQEEPTLEPEPEQEPVMAPEAVQEEESEPEPEKEPTGKPVLEPSQGEALEPEEEPNQKQENETP